MPADPDKPSPVPHAPMTEAETAPADPAGLVPARPGPPEAARPGPAKNAVSDGPAVETAAIADAPDEPVSPRAPRRARPTSGAPYDDREAERGLRGLVGSGSSQVSVGAALRARDATRPSDEQVADAEQNLTIVRRNWTPREDLPRNR